MKEFLKLFRLKKTISAVKQDFNDPDSVIDMMLIMLYLDGKISSYDIDIMEINFLHRIGPSEIIKLPRGRLLRELNKLKKINYKKFEEKRMMQNER